MKRRRRRADDARGREVTLASLEEVRAFLRAFERRREHAVAVREMTAGRRRRLVWTCQAAWVLGGLSLVGHTLSDIVGVGIGEAFFGGLVLMSLGAAIVLTAAVVATGAGEEARVRALAMLRVGVCPACLYEVEGVPREADGCVVCPECGAAWRLVGETDGGSGGA